jgi:hypothetical protein
MDARSARQRCQIHALRNHGVISRSEALDTGLSMRAIDRVLGSGEWLRLLPGVYALRGSPATFMRRVAAAYKWAGPGALISHSSSAKLLDLDGVEPLGIEVSTPRRLRSKKVVVHQRTTNGIPSLRIDGIRVTAAEPTLLDLACRLTPEKLDIALDSALRMGLTRFDRLKPSATSSCSRESPRIAPDPQKDAASTTLTQVRGCRVAALLVSCFVLGNLALVPITASSRSSFSS